MIWRCHKSVTLFSQALIEGTYNVEWVKNVYDNAAVVSECLGEFDNDGVIPSGEAIIRVFGRQDIAVNIGDKIVFNEFIDDIPPNDAYVVCGIKDNRHGSIPHIKIIAKR